VQPFLRQLNECVELEAKFRGSVQPSSAQVSPVSSMIESATITSGMRDGSAHVLRCLKVPIQWILRFCRKVSGQIHMNPKIMDHKKH
jgi:hypothetical protein